MRLRLIALIGLVLGLSRLAFPATLDAKHSPVRPKIAQKHRPQKLRARPVRRAPAPPRQHLVTPLIEAPELRLSLVDQSVHTPAAVQDLLPRIVVARAMPVHRRLDPQKPIRSTYWTAERVTADVMFVKDSRIVNASTRLIAIGDPHFVYDQQRAVTFRLAIRL